MNSYCANRGILKLRLLERLQLLCATPIKFPYVVIKNSIRYDIRDSIGDNLTV